MSGRRQILLAARREILERGRSRAFLLASLVQLLVVLAIIVISAVTGGDGAETYRVGAIGEEPTRVVEAAQRTQDAIGIEIDSSAPSSEEDARAAIEDDELDALVTEEELVTGQSPPAALVASIQTAYRDVAGVAALEGEGVDRPTAERALNPQPLSQEELGSGETDSTIGFIAALFLYIAILSFGIVVATGVVEEKSSRVIEMVLSAVRASRLLAGKVLGIGALGVAQLVVTAGISVAVALALGEVELPDTTLATLLLVIVYFILGYALYAAAFATGGALVSRQEDVGSATTPLTIVLVAAYLVSFQSTDDPDGTLAVVTSLLPPTAPIVAPTRIAQDAMPAGEILLSIVLLAVAIVAMIAVATKIYERTVLRVGSPLKLTQALALLRGRERID